MKSSASGTYLNRFLVLYTFLKIVHSQIRSEILRSMCINDIFYEYMKTLFYTGAEVFTKEEDTDWKLNISINLKIFLNKRFGIQYKRSEERRVGKEYI